MVAKRLDLDDDQIRVHACRVGGAFGGKTICTVELEAAVLALDTVRKALDGKPPKRIIVVPQRIVNVVA